MASHQPPPLDSQLREEMYRSSRALTRLSRIELVLQCLQLLPAVIALLLMGGVALLVGCLILFG